MTYFSIWLNSFTLRRLKEDLKQEKLYAIEVDRRGLAHSSLFQKLRHIWVNIKLKIQKCYSLPENSSLQRFCYKLRRNGSLENFIGKSILGFITGFLFTYLLFLFIVVQLNFSLPAATILCSVFGIILMLGLAFSWKIRCIFLLTIPQLFSERGRKALLAYAFILALTGPAKNTLMNMAIMNESLACGQEQLKTTMKQIIEVVRKPFDAIRDAIKTVIKAIKVIIEKIKEILIKIKRIIMSIVRVVKAAFQFLAKVLNICNKELGTPFERCSKVFDNAIQDCNAKLGPLFNWLCSITYLVKSVCYLVKIIDYVCLLVDFISNSIIGVVIRKVKSFVRHVKTMFYVKIRWSHDYEFKSEQSKTYADAAKNIIKEIKERTRGIQAIFQLFTVLSSFFFLIIILKVLHYRYRYMTSERFDNHFINRDFRIIDLRRAKHGRETVLPLNYRERRFYVNLSSWTLVKEERKKLGRALILILDATIKLAIHMIVDYCVFYILDLIKFYGKFQSKVSAPNMPNIRVEGQGLFAGLLKAVVNAFKPFGFELEIDTIPCLPNPIPPDYDRYTQITSLVGIIWILTILEPYGLRFRNWIMGYYEPLRQRQRTIWLYNHIFRERMNFLKFARRQLRRKFMGRKDLTPISFMDFLRAKLTCRFCQICLGSGKQPACLLCGEVFRDDLPPIHCQTPGCPGIFCELCYHDLKNLCPVCMSPIEYGDLSDMSEEQGSPDTSDEELNTNILKKDYTATERRQQAYEEQLLIKAQQELTSEEESESSEHSYSYQYEKTNSIPDAIEYSRSLIQIPEIKRKLDYATMEEFDEEQENIPPPNRNILRNPKVSETKNQINFKETPDGIPLSPINNVNTKNNETQTVDVQKRSSTGTATPPSSQLIYFTLSETNMPNQKGFIKDQHLVETKSKTEQENRNIPKYRDFGVQVSSASFFTDYNENKANKSSLVDETSGSTNIDHSTTLTSDNLYQSPHSNPDVNRYDSIIRERNNNYSSESSGDETGWLISRKRAKESESKRTKYPDFRR